MHTAAQLCTATLSVRLRWWWLGWKTGSNDKEKAVETGNAVCCKQCPSWVQARLGLSSLKDKGLTSFPPGSLVFLHCQPGLVISTWTCSYGCNSQMLSESNGIRGRARFEVDAVAEHHGSLSHPTETIWIRFCSSTWGKQNFHQPILKQTTPRL